MKASNHGDVCHFLYALQPASMQRDWFWELWLCFSPLLSHKEYVLFSRQCVFFINAHSHYYRPTEQNLPQREDLERLESFFLFSVCLLPYREHWIWSYDCRESVADRHFAGHCQLSNHPSHCSLALDYPNCSWCQQQASCSEKYAG